MRRTIKTFVVILILAYVLFVAWHYTHRFIFYRQTVLEVPIRFEQGFVLNQEFTVDMPANYYAAIKYDEIFRSTVRDPVPQDAFAAEFEIHSRDGVIAKGGTESFPEKGAPWAINRDQITRYLNGFHAEPGTRYSISLRITRLRPGTIGKNPQALVVIEPKFTLFYDLRKSTFIYASTGLGTIALGVCAYAALRWRKSMRRVE